MRKNLQKGFTLVELLLVIAIATSILGMFLGYTFQTGQQVRRDKAVMQIQQVINAALAFYTQNGRWPSKTGATTTTTWIALTNTGVELTDLQYLPAPTTPPTGTINSPYATPIYTSINATNNNFYVTTAMPKIGTDNKNTSSVANANIIAGQLPFGVIANNTATTLTQTDPVPLTTLGCSTTTVPAACFVMTSVPPPGQNLNNARSINFAALYHGTACVPAPTCPAGMIPQIFVVPTSVSGVNDPPTGCNPPNRVTGCKVNVYPISSYTAYAVGAGYGGSTSPGPNNYLYPGAPYYYTWGNNNMPSCTYGKTDLCFGRNNPLGTSTSVSVPTGYYWRVCLAVVTERGAVNPGVIGAPPGDVHGNPSPWGILEGTVMAVTRCVPGDATTGAVKETVGSDFTVFNPTGN